MKTTILFSFLFVGALACGSKTDSPTAATANPEAHDHHGDDHHGEGHHADGHHGEIPADAAIVPPGEATIGDTTTCPVSKETFVVSDNSPKVEYEGKTYYFCCGGCEKKFADNPAAFLGDDASS